MIDKEIILAFINGQGTGFSWIVLGFFAMIVALVAIKAAQRDVYQSGKDDARREGLENLQASIARLVHDQQEMKHKLFFTEPGE
jgi:hypothetical protein